jgi:hypothetical protein
VRGGGTRKETFVIDPIDRSAFASNPRTSLLLFPILGRDERFSCFDLISDTHNVAHRSTSCCASYETTFEHGLRRAVDYHRATLPKFLEV